jgi:hypothetical protein
MTCSETIAGTKSVAKTQGGEHKPTMFEEQKEASVVVANTSKKRTK